MGVDSADQRLADYQSLLEIGVELAGSLDLNRVLELALDRAENALYFLERDLVVKHPDANVLIRIADCQDRAAMRTLFASVSPVIPGCSINT